MPLFALLSFYVFAILALVQSFDPSVSNGTCYYDADQVADDVYIPCGNDALGHQTCCQARDVCLSSKACYNGKWGVTYLAGCTDIDYANLSVCPEKGDYHTQQWVGLVRCYQENDTSGQDERWVGCKDMDQPLVANPDHCTCTVASGVPGFWDSPALTNIASLPVSAGNLIAWYDGFTPSTTSTSEKSSLTSTTRGVTSSKTSQIPSMSPSITTGRSNQSLNPGATDDHTSELSVAAKAGIGVGSAVGSVIIICALAWFGLRSRRKPNLSPSSVLKHVRPRSQIDPVFHNKEAAVDHDLQSPAWSGNKSELPADEPRSASLLQSPYTQSVGEGIDLSTHSYPAMNTPCSDGMDGSQRAIQELESRQGHDHSSAPTVYELPG